MTFVRFVAPSSSVVPLFPCGHKRVSGNTRLVDGVRVCRTCTQPQRERKPQPVKPLAFRKIGISYFCKACNEGTCAHKGPCLKPVALPPDDFGCSCLTYRPVRWREETKANNEYRNYASVTGGE